MGKQVSYLIFQKWAKGVYSVKCPVTLKTSFLYTSAASGKVWVPNTVLYDSEMEKVSRQR